MIGSNRTFYLKCSDTETFNQWKKRLEHSINGSTGAKKELSLDMYKDEVNLVFDFWRYLRISEEAF